MSGMERLVELDQEADFIGKDALRRISQEGVSRKLVGVSLSGGPMEWELTYPWPVMVEACAGRPGHRRHLLAPAGAEHRLRLGSDRVRRIRNRIAGPDARGRGDCHRRLRCRSSTRANGSRSARPARPDRPRGDGLPTWGQLDVVHPCVISTAPMSQAGPCRPIDAALVGGLGTGDLRDGVDGRTRRGGLDGRRGAAVVRQEHESELGVLSHDVGGLRRDGAAGRVLDEVVALGRDVAPAVECGVGRVLSQESAFSVTAPDSTSMPAGLPRVVAGDGRTRDGERGGLEQDPATLRDRRVGDDGRGCRAPGWSSRSCRLRCHPGRVRRPSLPLASRWCRSGR